MIRVLGMIGAVILPLWNIPLIRRIHQRRSSQDISLAWAFGVLICFLIMLPSALRSPDPVFKWFSIVNIFFFGAVVIEVIRYREWGGKRRGTD